MPIIFALICVPPLSIGNVNKTSKTDYCPIGGGYPYTYAICHKGTAKGKKYPIILTNQSFVSQRIPTNES